MPSKPNPEARDVSHKTDREGRAGAAAPALRARQVVATERQPSFSSLLERASYVLLWALGVLVG
jgi:hypothetical protein